MHVLVCEDNPVTGNALAELMRLEGWRVTLAASGGDCLACCLAARPDVLLLDHCLPDITGMEVLLRLRHCPDTATLPVVIATALAPALVEEMREAAGRYGAVRIIQRPCEPRQVLDALWEMARADGGVF